MQTGPRRVHLERSGVIRHRGGRSWRESTASNSSKTSLQLTEKSNWRRHTRTHTHTDAPLRCCDLHSPVLFTHGDCPLLWCLFMWHSRFGQLSEKLSRAAAVLMSWSPLVKKTQDANNPKVPQAQQFFFLCIYFQLMYSWMSTHLGV